MARAKIDVPLDDLESLATNLGTLEKDLKSIDDSVKHINSLIHSSKVTDAMNDFSDNWDAHRKRMIESVEAVHKMAEDSFTAFSDKDLELANTILGKDN